MEMDEMTLAKNEENGVGVGLGVESLDPLTYPELLSLGVCVLGLFCKHSLEAFS